MGRYQLLVMILCLYAVMYVLSQLTNWLKSTYLTALNINQLVIYIKKHEMAHHHETNISFLHRNYQPFIIRSKDSHHHDHPTPPPPTPKSSAQRHPRSTTHPSPSPTPQTA